MKSKLFRALAGLGMLGALGGAPIPAECANGACTQAQKFECINWCIENYGVSGDCINGVCHCRIP